MKQKILISALSLLLTFSLVGCGGQQAQQEPQEPDQEKVQQAEPASTTPPVESMEVKNENDTAIPLAELEDVEAEEADGASIVEGAGSVESNLEEVQLFTEVNETVYATGTVNIRASWSANSEKLGSLAVGDSVTRTGIAIEGTEAEGWSRVTLSNGTTAYISNSYLSTTKPVVQQQTSKPSGGQQQQQQTQQQPTQQQTPQGGGTTQTQQPQQNKDGWDQAFYETLNPEQKKVYEGYSDATDRNMMQQSIEKKRQREADGWIVEAGTPTEEQLEEAWSNMTFGQ